MHHILQLKNASSQWCQILRNPSSGFREIYTEYCYLTYEYESFIDTTVSECLLIVQNIVHTTGILTRDT